MSYRIKQINNLIMQEVGQIILNEIEFQKGKIITITKVETTRDLRYAKIMVSVIPNSYFNEAMSKLNSRIYEIQDLLKKRLRLHPIPRISFLIDRQNEQADRIIRMLNKIKK